MKKKIGLIITLLFIVLMVFTFMYFVSEFYGNPVLKLIVKNKAEKYLEENYATENFKIEKPVYNFKFNTYEAYCYVENSQDMNFSIIFSKRGKLLRDNYDECITQGYNTANRLTDEFNEYVENMIKEKLPYKYSILSCFVEVINKNVFTIDEKFSADKFLAMSKDELKIDISDYIVTDNKEINWDNYMTKLYELDKFLQVNGIKADRISLMLDSNENEKTYNSFGVHDITREMLESDNLKEQLMEKYIVDGVMPEISFFKVAEEPNEDFCRNAFYRYLVKWDGVDYNAFIDFKPFMNDMDLHHWSRTAQIAQMKISGQYNTDSEEFNNSRMEFVEYYKLGTTFTIEMDYGKQPDKCIVTDFIINSDGSIKYDASTAMKTELVFKDNVAAYTIKENPAVFASSDLSDYKDGNVIRGIQLSCDFGENKANYLYIFKTDASK